MALPDPPTYDVPELERKATELLNEILGPEFDVPVDIDLLAERLKGVSLDYARGLREHHSLDGAVLRDTDTGELLIIVDEWLADSNPNRYRMTIAEEVAHIVLHRRLIDAINDVATFRELHQHPRFHQIERNAKRCAAALLMPGSAVVELAQEIYPQLVKVAGFNDVTAVQKYLASQLAKVFEVSAETMRYRLNEWPMRIFDRVAQAIQDKLTYLP